ncbi:hypothetical protein QBC45DRAFT_43849 [Copromyces sp. CBS 386.78]|nr:hypothetical protein QBC45DRAFT_43849 [Copromyces sp. CBS 386.78]
MLPLLHLAYWTRRIYPSPTPGLGNMSMSGSRSHSTTQGFLFRLCANGRTVMKHRSKGRLQWPPSRLALAKGVLCSDTRAPNWTGQAPSKTPCTSRKDALSRRTRTWPGYFSPTYHCVEACVLATDTLKDLSRCCSPPRRVPVKFKMSAKLCFVTTRERRRGTASRHCDQVQPWPAREVYLSLRRGVHGRYDRKTRSFLGSQYHFFQPIWGG